MSKIQVEIISIIYISHVIKVLKVKYKKNTDFLELAIKVILSLQTKTVPSAMQTRMTNSRN